MALELLERVYSPLELVEKIEPPTKRVAAQPAARRLMNGFSLRKASAPTSTGEPVVHVTVQMPEQPAPVVHAHITTPDVHVTNVVPPAPRPAAVRVETQPDGTRRYVPETEEQE